MSSSSSASSGFPIESSSSREPTPEWNPAEVHAANTRRAIEAGNEPSHDFSIWSEDDKSLTDGESDLRFLADKEAVEESEDDRFPWDGATSEEVKEEEEEDDDDDSSPDEPPAKRHCPWPGNLSDFDSDDDDDDEEDEDNEGPVGGRWSSDDEPAGSSADSGDDGDDEGSNGP